ncbi:hypothetical protein BSKO_01761 [Bryopsis sp. KO-2023]|nr:hypothetical protein BSKO_01761 [Bryopsis sp. KO-2023]
MAATFVADIKLQDSNEILQLPLLRQKPLKKLWDKANKNLAALGVGTIHQLDDTLENYLQHAGKFFGKDPTKWEQVGTDKVDVVEEGGKRTIKSTGVYSGTELELYMEHPFFDDRLPVDDTNPGLNFNVDRKQITTDEEWKEIVDDQPWTPSIRRQMLTRYLNAKLVSNEPELQKEGAHALWELAVNKDHHADLPKERVCALLESVDSTDLEVARLSAAAIWALSTSSIQRQTFTELNVVQTLIGVAQKTLKMSVVPNETPDPKEPTESQRDDLQAFVLGSLSVLLVDRVCRAPLIALEPDLNTIVTMCQDLEGYNEKWGLERRVVACKMLTGIIQRDHEVRMKIIDNGRIKIILELLNGKGCGSKMIQFCMASILATLVLDDDAMELINTRKECTLMMEWCLVLLARTIESLRPNDKQLDPSKTQEEVELDRNVTVRIAEGCAQAIWGSAYFCALDSAHEITLDHMLQLSELGIETVQNQTVPLGRVTHCISATLATFCSEFECATTLMSDPKDTTLKTLMFFLSVEDKASFTGSGHVRAAACTGLAFLACHRIGAQGDECLTGPFREKLLDIGAFGGLLLAALEPPEEEQFKTIIEQSAAVGVMYLSTMAGDVDAGSLSALTSLLNNTQNVEMVEYLMAAMWILLRNPNNRRALSTAFSENPANTITRDIHSKIQDAIEVYGVQENMAAVRRDSMCVDELDNRIPKEGEIEGGDCTEAIPKNEEESALSKEGQESAGAGDKENLQRSTGGTEPNGAPETGNPEKTGAPEDGIIEEGAPDDEALESDWGLDTLVRVGENWLPRIMLLNVASDDSDAPLLKLFEFLSASLCLFMVEDVDELPLNSIATFEYGALAASKRKGWFTVNAPLPDIDSTQPDMIERALHILTQLLHLTIPRAWKTMQLCCATLWNVTCRSPEIQKRVVELGIFVPLLDIVNRSTWPASLRECASGHLQNLAEYWPNVCCMGGLMPLLRSLVTLCNSSVPLLEHNGARGIARATFHVPDGCNAPQATLDECKAGVAQAGGITALTALLQRLNQKYSMLKNGEVLSPPRSPLLADFEDDPTQYEKDMENIDAVLSTYRAVLTSLVNVSTLKINQLKLGKCALFTLLGTNCLFAERGGPDYKSEPEGALVTLCSAVIQNLSLHPKNRTRLYKAELRGSLAFGRGLGLDFAEQERSSVKTPMSPTKHSCPSPPRSPLRGARPGSPDHNRQLAASHRPKVVFPPICDENITMRTNLSRRQSRASPNILSGPILKTYESEPIEARNLELEENPKRRFMTWLDTTFGETEISNGLIPPPKNKQSFRLPMVDSEGNWINGRNPMPAVNSLLQRPLCHVWEDPHTVDQTPDARWNPGISEYIEPRRRLGMGPTASTLLCTKPPELGTGRFSEKMSSNRPTTCDRFQGRVPMTALQFSQQKEQESTSDSHKDGKEGHDPSRVSLKVAISPKRQRTVISFEDCLSIDSDLRRPHLTMFEHVDGARVSESLFPDYTLPNGKKTFYYYDSGSMINEVAMDILPPPERPTSVPAALQQSMPLAEVLNLIAKPPGSAPPFIPYKPVPRLVPLPDKHTLSVKYPESLDTSTFGDLREDNLQLVIVAKNIVKTKTSTTTEKIEVQPQEEREPWTLPMSIFKPRVKESDAKDYCDTPKVVDNMFERDWARCCQKEKFTSMLCREAKNTKTQKDDKTIIKEMHDVLKGCYQKFVSAFVYYASTGGGDPYHMTLNSFTSFLDDCEIPDHESQAIKRSDCDTIFIVANFIMDKKSKDNAVNNEQALMRFEFMEAIVRIGISKYIKSQETDDICQSVQMLMDQNIYPNLPLPATIEPNDFRNSRLYTEEVDLLYKKHIVLLKALYSRYRLKPSGGGLRPKVLKIDGWLQLFDDTKLVDTHFTLQDAVLCFLWSRMIVQDEVKDFGKYESMTFVDMLEGLGRVAEMKSLPSMLDLDDAGYENMFEWAAEKEQKGEEGEKQDVFRRRPSGELGIEKTRPLVVKLEGLLDLIFRRLYFDPSQPENEFTHDALLKMVKKIDKDMGP